MTVIRATDYWCDFCDHEVDVILDGTGGEGSVLMCFEDTHIVTGPDKADDFAGHLASEFLEES